MAFARAGAFAGFHPSGAHRYSDARSRRAAVDRIDMLATLFDTAFAVPGTKIRFGAEALLRWQHPERGFIPPGEFIPVAEETGQIGAIGAWVLQEACRQARAWQDKGLQPIRVGVNISAAQFHQPGLVDGVRSALECAGLPPGFLEIELTETCVMSNPEESIAILEELSRMGVLVSVDDFGTGYSSMSYLRRFPIDKLKIDKAFVAEMDTRTDDASIVQAIVSLAHGLQLKVVAEGVETAAQLDALRALGCDEYQGFYCSPALPAQEFEMLMRIKAAEPRPAAATVSSAA